MPPSAATHGRVGVVTVSHRSSDVIPAFLASIPMAYSGPVEVVVADNLPDPAVRELVTGTGAHYLPLSVNRGYGSGINRAVASLDESIEWVLISNPDIVLGSGAIAALVEQGSQDDRIAAVGPLIQSPDGSVYPSARAIPSLRTGVGHALFSGIWPDNPWTRSYRAEGESPTRARDAGWLSGACVLVRRKIFEELGGFDTGYFMYFEDVDLGYRFGRNGYRNVYEPAARVVHLGGHSTDGGTAPAMAHAHHRSARRFIVRKYPGLVLAPLRWSLNAGLALRELITARRV